MSHQAILHDASHCANCGAVASGNFCQACGQETTLHMPSAGEFLHEFVGHYVALEGKLWKTLKLLLFKPGQLTREYLEGRRARYVAPLRVYLTLSILFFAVFKYSGHEDTVNIGRRKHPPAAEAVQAAQAAKAALGEAAADAGLAGSAGAHDGDAELHKVLAWVHPKLAEKGDKLARMDEAERNRELKHAFFGYAPYAVFCLMPLFALFLKVLYLGSGRRYGEHLLFALHTNGFAFLMLGIMLLVPRVPFLGLALTVWLVFYLPTAMRRVYGGTRRATAARWLVLASLHVLSILAAIVGAFGLAILAA